MQNLVCFIVLLFFFFQAEDGIRDSSVTGVQTCALPIFMTREGLWLKQHREGVVGRRIPRMLIASIDQPVLHANGEFWEPDIEDEQAQQALLSVEQSDLPLLVLPFPDKLKAVLLLIFCECKPYK